MKVVTNTKLIKRNAKIGQYTSIGALVILGVGLYISFKMPDKFVYSLWSIASRFLSCPKLECTMEIVGAAAPVLMN